MDSALVVVAVDVDVVWARARQLHAHVPHTCTRASCLSRSRDACNEHVNGNSGLPDVHFGVPSSSSSSAQRHLATHCRLEGGAWQRYLPRLGWLLSDWLATPVLLSICRYCDTVCVCVLQTPTLSSPNHPRCPDSTHVSGRGVRRAAAPFPQPPADCDCVSGYKIF